MEILAGMRVECVYRYRNVCQEWKALLSSKYFLTSKGAERPRLLLCSTSLDLPCMSFCFYTRTWKACFSLSFLPRVPGSYGQVNCRGSAAGLLLVDHEFRSILGRVCNPYTRTYVTLPAMSNIATVFDRCIVVENSGSENYKVVVVGRGDVTRFLNFVEVYDSCERKFEVAGHLPEELMLATRNTNAPDRSGYCRDLIYCDGSFYCVWKGRDDMPEGIVCFTIPSQGTGMWSAGTPIPFFLAPFPFGSMGNAPHLLVFGSRLLVVMATEPANGEGEDIIIMEFQNGHRHHLAASPSWKWKAVSRIPSSIRKSLRKNIWKAPVFDCVGVGDHVCFRSDYPCTESEIKVLVYNLRTRLWSLLPSLPNMAFNDGRYRFPYANHISTAFEPRPRMRIG